MKSSEITARKTAGRCTGLLLTFRNSPGAKAPPGILGVDAGMSILELLVVLLLLSFFMSSAVSNLSRLKNPLEDASSGALGFTKEVRARAAATTSAYVLYPASANELRAKYANNCSATSFTVDPALRFELPEHSVLTDTTWSICFNSRGLAETNESFIIQNLEGESRTLEVFLGGAVRIQP